LVEEEEEQDLDVVAGVVEAGDGSGEDEQGGIGQLEFIFSPSPLY
jgi:hypothetical protein